MNIDYSQFYRGTTNIPSFGNGAYKKDTLIKYEFNTTDEHGNKVMDKCVGTETAIGSKENTVIALYTDTEKTSSDRHSTFIG